MKKTLIYALALALALSLAACGQPTDPAPGTSTPEPIAAPEPIKDTTPKTAEGAQPPEDGQALEELNHDELIAVFGPVYEASKEVNNSDSEETIQNELLMIEMTAASMSKSLPSDYETQYREWRPSVVQQDTQTAKTTQQNQQSQSQQSQGQQGQSSQTQQPSQQQQYDPSIDQGTMDDGGFTIQTKEDIDAKTSNPYSGYGEVNIGYGG